MSASVPIINRPKPAGSLWTDEQWQAISSSGKDILVAAAAGSGKTAVLVERIIRKVIDPEDPVDVDRLLIVTFTNAAAAEMKKRIGEALEQELLREPWSLFLKRQLSLLNQASISTLHSFCLDVLRTYYFQLDLDPKFRIAEDTEIVLIKEEVLEELFEEYYSRADDESFFRLVDSFSSDRSDQDLQSLVLQLHEFSRSHPFPREWLDQTVMEIDSDIIESWTNAILTLVQQQLQGLVEQLEQGLALTRLPAGPAAYALNLEEDLVLIRTLLHACQSSWEEAFAAFKNMSFGRLKSVKGDEIDPELQVRVREIRDRVKKEAGQLKEEYFLRTLEEYLQDLERMAPVLHTLIEVVKEFDQRFTQAKRKKALVDFPDLEHYCLYILKDEASTISELIPSDAANKYKQKFVEILVDEYQDTNLVQESILRLICNNETNSGNLFMVGDVKQSIYRFRMAEPSLFLNKYKAFQALSAVLETSSTALDEPDRTEIDLFTYAEHAEHDHSLHSERHVGAEQGWRIDLARNFRSRSQVLSGTNFIFKQIMNEQVGEIEYDQDAELKLGASYPDDHMPIEFTLINRDTSIKEVEDGWTHSDRAESYDQEEASELEAETSADQKLIDEVELETVQLEARYMAKRIKEMIGTHDEASFQVYDSKRKLYRPIQYRDIVILLRASSVWAPTILEEFKQQGIPAYAELTTGYFEATEVAIMLALLKIIDNPYQDIPLAGVLRSPIVGLQGEELAQIRLVQKNGSYYDALRVFVDEEDREDGDKVEGNANEEDRDKVSQVDINEQLQKKLRTFVENLKLWRDRARQGSLAELIWQLYRETGFYDYVGGMPGGNQRQANLRALYDRARQYEATSFRGLFRFLRFIERMQDRGSDLGAARALSEQEDVVRIMTIHKSKGLEFPVVFIAGLGKMFNQSDIRQKLLMHKELGLGSKVIDVEQRISYPSLPYLLIKNQIQQEMLAEEMRVLYVALTRAKEKLILVGTLRDVQKKINQWSQLLATDRWVLPDSLRSRAKSYLDWVGPAIIRHRQAKPLLQYGQGQGEDELPIQHSLPEDYEDSSSWEIKVVEAHELVEVDEIHSAVDEERLQAIFNREPLELESKHVTEVGARLSWNYAYPMSQSRLAKQSVTELKRQRLWLNQEELAYEHTLTSFTASAKAERPKFMQVSSSTAAERGTAMHTVMQHLPLGQSLSIAEVQVFIEQLVADEKLTPEEAAFIQLERIVQFTTSEVNQLFAQAEEVHREIPFTYALSAKKAFAEWTQDTDDQVIIQGVIDSLCKVNGNWMMVDYKTDMITDRFPGGIDEAKPVLLERYRIQLQLYARAIEQIWRVPVHRRILYFFDGGHLLEVESNTEFD